MKMIHLNNVDLNLLIVFDCIYQERSITAAGGRLGRTQSAVSHSLDKLRTLFNDPLFVRTANKMRPTPRADQLAIAVRKALSTIQDVLVTPENFTPNTLDRTFVLSMSDYCEIVVLPRLMKTIHQLAPLVKIEVLSPATSDPQSGLESGTFDLVIGNKDLERGIFQQRLYVDEFVCMVNKNHPGIQGEMSMADYLGNAHVLFAPQGGADSLEKSLKKQNIKRSVVVQLPNITVIPHILKETPYIVTLPRRLAESMDVSSLQILPPPMPLPEVPVMQYWHEAMNNDPVHKWLRKVIQQSIESSK